MPDCAPRAVVHELERGLGVVVQPAHHPRVDDIRHAQRVQVRQHGVEVLLGDIGQVVEQHRGIGRHRAHLGPLVVEHPQRVDLGAPSGVLVEVELKQELLQQFPILRAAAVIAQRGDFQPEPVEAQRAETGVGDRDHLGVQRRVVDADRLDTDLLQLAVAAGLRTLVAEERARVTQFHRQRAAVQAVFDHRAHHAGGALGPQRHRAVAAVGEGVHLLGHHIGGLADAAGEQRGVLEDRQLDVAVAGPAGGGQQAVAHRDELRRIRRDVVRHSLGRRERGEFASPAQAFEERVEAPFGADGGGVAMPGQHHGLVVEHQQFVDDRA